MKGVVRMVARLLLAYIVALPALFVGHSFQHEPATVDLHKIWFENTQLTGHCELCDFYFNQTVII